MTGFEGLRGGVSRWHTGSLGMARSNFEMIEVAVDTQCEEGSRRPADGVAAGKEIANIPDPRGHDIDLRQKPRHYGIVDSRCGIRLPNRPTLLDSIGSAVDDHQRIV